VAGVEPAVVGDIWPARSGTLTARPSSTSSGGTSWSMLRRFPARPDRAWARTPARWEPGTKRMAPFSGSASSMASQPLTANGGSRPQ
jgi:hypothetical protein